MIGYCAHFTLNIVSYSNNIFSFSGFFPSEPLRNMFITKIYLEYYKNCNMTELCTVLTHTRQLYVYR